MILAISQRSQVGELWTVSLYYYCLQVLEQGCRVSDNKWLRSALNVPKLVAPRLAEALWPGKIKTQSSPKGR